MQLTGSCTVNCRADDALDPTMQAGRMMNLRDCGLEEETSSGSEPAAGDSRWSGLGFVNFSVSVSDTP